MKKQIISMATLVALVLLCCCTADAKKKLEEPVLESFVANYVTASGSAPFTVAIQEFSTDHEVQQLAQIYARGGEDSLQSATRKSRKGYFTVGSSDKARLRIIRARPVGTGRRLQLVGEAADALFRGVFVGPMGARGYDFSCIQLSVDEHGDGQGLLLPYCKVAFNKQGELVFTPGVLPPSLDGPLNRLANVHWKE